MRSAALVIANIVLVFFVVRFSLYYLERGRLESGVKWLVGSLCASVAIMVMLSFPALECHALETSITEGYSVTKAAPNGVWKQEGFSYQHNLESKSYTFAVNGYPLWTWLKVEGGYKDYGSISGELRFVSDENYSSNPADPCRDPCESPRSAYFTGTSRGVYIGASPTIKFEGGEIGAGVGRIFFYAQTLVTAQNYHSNFVKDPNPSIGVYNEENVGSSWLLSLNFSYKIFHFFYSQAPDIKAGFNGLQRGVEELFMSIAGKNGQSLLLGIDRHAESFTLTYTKAF